MAASIRLKLLATLLLAGIAFLPYIGAIDFNIIINEKMDGRAVLIERDDSKAYHLAKVHWENIGSVPCDATLRLDFINSSDGSVYHTAWSKRHEMPTGSFAEIRAAAVLPAGDYTAKMRVYACNEIFGIGEYNFTSGLDDEIANRSVREYSHGLSILSAEAFEDRIEVEIENIGGREQEKIAVMPEKYPLGWIVSFDEIDTKKGERQKAKIYYRPPLFRDSYVTFVAISEDGKGMAKKTLFIKKPEDRTGLVVAAVVMAFLFVLSSIWLKRRVERIQTLKRRGKK